MEGNVPSLPPNLELLTKGRDEVDNKHHGVDKTKISALYAKDTYYSVPLCF